MANGKAGRPLGRKDSAPRRRVRPFVEALNLSINRALAKGPDRGRKALAVIADRLVAEAVKGEAWAIREIADRLDGRPAVQINHANAEGEELPSGIAVVFVPSAQDGESVAQ